MLLAVSITFIALHTPSHAIRLRLLFAEFFEMKPALYLHELRLQRLFELLYYSNFATNCITYFVFGKAFRDLYKQLYCFCCCQEKAALEVRLRESRCAEYPCESLNMEVGLDGAVTETDLISSDAIMLRPSEAV